MHFGNRPVGLGFTALGVVGMVVCVAGIVSAWIASSHVRQFTSEVFRQVDRLLGQVDRRLEQSRDAVGETRDLVDELQQALRDSTSDIVAVRVASLPEIVDLEQRLASTMERAEGLVQLSASTAELIEQLLVALGAFVLEGNEDLRGSTELMASIQSTRQSLANASEHLSNLQRRLGEIRQERDVASNLPQIMKLSLGIVGKLDMVHQQITAFHGRLDETQTRLRQLHIRLGAWIRRAQYLIQLVIAWAGAGQVCLLVYGWRILRPSTFGRLPEQCAG